MVFMVESLSTNILLMNEAIVGHLCLQCNHESFDPRKLRSVVGYGYYIDYFNFTLHLKGLSVIEFMLEHGNS